MSFELQLHEIKELLHHMNKTLKDIQQQLVTLSVSVAANGDAEKSVVTLLQGLSAQNAELNAQLQAAIANNDQATIQAVSDQLAAQNAALDDYTAKLAAAAVANTIAAPTGGNSSSQTAG